MEGNVDDMSVKGKTFEQHLLNLEEVFFCVWPLSDEA